MATARIPTLDIRRFTDPSSPGDREAFVAELGACYREWGFAGIRGHGIATDLVDRAYDAFKRFFALPQDVKMKYHVPGSGGARGYTPFMVETAKDSLYPDLKEFWHIGREIPDDSPYRAVMPPNLWPEEVPEFRELGYGLYQALDALGSKVLSALALHIGLPEQFFADKTNYGNSILRPIHYPPITTPDIPNVRAAPHEDINFITLLVGASARRAGGAVAQGRVDPVHRRRGHHRRQHRRHAAAAHQPRVPVDHPSRGQSAGREGAPAALFGAVLPAPESGLRDRRAALVRERGQPSRYPEPIITDCP